MHAIDALFQPRRIAVFGASESNSVGGVVMQNLLAGGFDGEIVPINPKHDEVHGHVCHRDLESYGGMVDLALIATPAQTVPGIIEACGNVHVPAAIVYSAGFAERGESGAARERKLVRLVRRHRMRLLGPNCIGLLSPHHKLNASFGRNAALPGNIGLISQSGAICSAVLDWAEARKVGFSAVVSVGSAADVGFGELLDFLAMDTRTEAILLYVEGIRGTRRFMSGLRAAARLKPVIVLKAGRYEAGTRAARSHTGALVGGYDVFEAAVRRAGAVRVDSIGQLFAAANVLARYRRVGGNRLTVVTNAGGPGVMATDRAVERGLELSELAPETIAALDRQLPAHWPRANPVDILGDANAERYAGALASCAADSACDGLLVMNAPTAISDPVELADAVIGQAAQIDKPVLTCWLGGAHALDARRRFTAAGIPSFATPEAAVDSFSYLAEYHASQELLLQAPRAVAEPELPDVGGARMIIQAVLDEGREALNERESKALLKAFGIPINLSIPANDVSSALIAAETIGFPVAMKVESPDVSHKSDVDGVRLDIENASQVGDAFHALRRSLASRAGTAAFTGVVVQAMVRRRHGRELMIGAFRDPAFGPVVAFGAGGTSVEILQDRSVGLPPLNAFLADRMVQGTRVSRMLGAFRNLPPIADGTLRNVLLCLSNMVCELPEVLEVDINPLIVDEEGAIAVDARIFVKLPDQQRPYSHLAVHPYPVHCRYESRLRDGRRMLIRPIRPEDAAEESRFVASLSPQARYFRFMNALRELSPTMLTRFTQIDYSREMALVALVETADGPRQVGVSRYVGDPDYDTCEFAIVVSDEVQGQGIGRELMRRLIEIAHDQDFERMHGEILAENEAMLGLARGLGFDIVAHPEDPGLRQAVLPLRRHT